MLSRVKYLRFGVVAILLVLNGCVISPRRDGSGNNGGGNNGGGGGGFGRIYVTNAPNNSIIRFNNASTVSGNASPGTTISGSATLLATPNYLFLDVANDRLFVANEGGPNVLVFDNASTQTGNVAPTRTISGSNTQFSSPADVALDKTRDLLYVADSSGTILVFTHGSSAGGNISPARTLSVGFVPTALFSDGANDRLFVADINSNAVRIFDTASTLSGVVTAPRILIGGTTQLNQPAGLQIDNSGRLLVSNAQGSNITIYSGAASISGDVAPVATIGGSNTGMLSPTQIVLNNTTTTGDLYIADGVAARVVIFANIGSTSGNINATRTITGSQTGLDRSGGVGPATAKGIALDTAR